MNAWHKALLKTTAQRPVLGFQVDCMHCDDPSRQELVKKETLIKAPWGGMTNMHPNPNPCHLSAYDQEFDYTKTSFLRLVKSLGWTYDKEGNWLCPACSKGGDR